METYTSIATYAIPGLKFKAPSLQPDDERILKIVADHFGFDHQFISSKTRKQEVLVPRQLAMVMYKKHTNKSLVNIGKICGEKDHATVLHAIRAINNWIETNGITRDGVNVRKEYEELDKKCAV